MPFQNSGQSGSQPVASSQLALNFTVDTSVADYQDDMPILLTRGLPRVVLLAMQTAGASAAMVQLQCSVANDTGPGQTSRRWVDIGPSVLTPLNVAQTIEVVAPTKFVRVLVTRFDSPPTDATLDLTLMAAQ